MDRKVKCWFFEFWNFSGFYRNWKRNVNFVSFLFFANVRLNRIISINQFSLNHSNNGWRRDFNFSNDNCNFDNFLNRNEISLKTKTSRLWCLRSYRGYNRSIRRVAFRGLLIYGGKKERKRLCLLKTNLHMKKLRLIVEWLYCFICRNCGE